MKSAYEACLAQELRKRGLLVKTQVPFPIVYDTVRLQHGDRIDMLVEDLIVIEFRACEAIAPVH